MVSHGHEILVRGVDLAGTEHKPPVLMQMNDDDFPARYLRDLAAAGEDPISSTAPVSGATLFQPVQRILHLAMADLKCSALGSPRVDPARVLSAGLVIRRCVRKAGLNGGATYDDMHAMAAWMRSPSGRFQWIALRPDQENLDPDPVQRPQLTSGQAALDAQLAALSLATANTESATPAFGAPPATCASLKRTIFYAVIPTASSEVSDIPPASPPAIDKAKLIASLPQLLRSCEHITPPQAPAPLVPIDYRWLSDDFLTALYPPSPNPPTPGAQSRLNPQFKLVQGFILALRMLQGVFGAFDGTAEGNEILAVLNRHNVYFDPSAESPSQPMGDFFQTAKTVLLDYSDYLNPAPSVTRLTMPQSWDGLDDSDETSLVYAMIAALTPRSQNLLAPQGRFQDGSRQYRLRLFFRLKPEMPGCPPELVWSHYSDPFRIAPWFEGGQRPHPPIPMPDPASLLNAKPNCSFQVPGSLMGAMQGASLSGLMNGSGGGTKLGLDWICGFNIPLITICAFFVLNIFLSLLNIVFFWLPIIKICIPFPSVSTSSPDQGSP